VLIGARLAQGIAGGAAIVIARAIVRDLHAGAAAARYTVLMLVNGVAPVTYWCDVLSSRMGQSSPQRKENHAAAR
jgi:hypothetical protein